MFVSKMFDGKFYHVILCFPKISFQGVGEARNTKIVNKQAEKQTVYF